MMTMRSTKMMMITLSADEQVGDPPPRTPCDNNNNVVVAVAVIVKKQTNRPTTQATADYSMTKAAMEEEETCGASTSLYSRHCLIVSVGQQRGIILIEGAATIMDRSTTTTMMDQYSRQRQCTPFGDRPAWHRVSRKSGYPFSHRIHHHRSSIKPRINHNLSHVS